MGFLSRMTSAVIVFVMLAIGTLAVVPFAAAMPGYPTTVTALPPAVGHANRAVGCAIVLTCSATAAVAGTGATSELVT
jgi:hypothetical protein